MKKPRSMKMREFRNRVEELNKYLPDFPPNELGVAEMLDDQEIVDILEFSIPPGWKKTMRVQGHPKTLRPKRARPA